MPLLNARWVRKLVRRGGIHYCRRHLAPTDAPVITRRSSLRRGLSALHCAALSKNPEFLQLFLTFGVDVNVKDKTGWTPLMYAASKGQLQNLKHLLQAGADTLVRDKFGTAASDLSDEFKFPECHALLQDYEGRQHQPQPPKEWKAQRVPRRTKPLAPASGLWQYFFFFNCFAFHIVVFFAYRCQRFAWHFTP
eukprot:m.53585 g.53585  ORF g.53585 m.53585 type:complete len:193 (+) comp48607_c0_seq1:157-735(+)